LENRLDKAKERLEDARETVKAICEPVLAPREQANFYAYFSAVDNADEETLKDNEPKRIALYKNVVSLIRAYANIANEMEDAGYTPSEIEKIRSEVAYYKNMRDEIRYHSGDYVDMKRYEPSMRRMLDTYIQADPSELVADFEELGLIELLVEKGLGALDGLPKGLRENKTAMAETIENNVRKVIIDERAVNPKYYENMSELLDALIQQRRSEAIEYEIYLQKIKDLAEQVTDPGKGGATQYPVSIDSLAKRALYDNFGEDEELAAGIDAAVLETKKDDWKGNRFKEREVRGAINQAIKERQAGYDISLENVMNLVKKQNEYD
ncbi:MAG: restriction endonuclease subunit R, partial [Anaerolineae bacterium]|nr:restriction endonuclease subunit R [Anaerolineae bacterium]